MIVDVAGQHFKSKTALLTRIREILYACDLGAFIGPEDSAFLDACLEQANRYYGYPIEKPAKWRVQEHSTWKNREFVFYRNDDTRENPSIKRLAMTKPKGPKPLKSGARQDIAYQVLAFRGAQLMGNGYQCSECDHNSRSASEFEVHHIVPFTELWDAFLSDMGATEAKLSIVEERDDTGAMITFGLAYPWDIAFKGFHKKHAKLQLLCLGCHAHKTYAATQE